MVRGGAQGVRHPVPSLKERFDRFEEQLDVITGLWARRRRSFDFDGTYYQVSNSPGLLGPKRLLPIIIGGGGPARTPTSPPVRG